MATDRSRHEEPALLRRLRQATRASGLHVDPSMPLRDGGLFVVTPLAQTAVLYLSRSEPETGQRLSEELRDLSSPEAYDLLLQERGFTYFHVVQFLYEWAKHHSRLPERDSFCYGMGIGGGGVEVRPAREVTGLLELLSAAMPPGDDAARLGDLMTLVGPLVLGQIFSQDLMHLDVERTSPLSMRMSLRYTDPDALRESLRPYGLQADLGAFFYNTVLHVQGTARLGFATFARNVQSTVRLGTPLHLLSADEQARAREQLTCAWDIEWSDQVRLRRLAAPADVLERGRSIYEGLHSRDIDVYLQRIQSLEVRLQRMQEGGRFHDLVGRSARMHQLYQLLEQVAGSDLTVLVRGESGTGKELVARALHQSSPRAEGPFIPVNCAAFTETLLESELFGHEKGAFTGADETKPGRFELADGGTLFLDEVGDIPLTTQVKLLRALESRSFERVGGTRPLQVDVRIVAATNRDLEQLIASGDFREDLYFRLNVVPVQLPALREHAEDIPQLALLFLEQLAERAGTEAKALSRGGVDCLLRYSWPGNIRELRNVIERAAVVYATGDLLDEAAITRALGLQVESVRPTVSLNARQRLLLGCLSEAPESTIDDLLPRIAGGDLAGGRSRRTLQNDLRHLAELGLARWLKDGALRRYAATGDGERLLDELD